MNHKGALAEEKVSVWLERQGWKTLARNYRHIGFELDIVSVQGKTLLVTEVKSRPSIHDENDLRPGDYLTDRQISKIKKGIVHFLSEVLLDIDSIRMDLVVVMGMRQDKLARYKNIRLNSLSD
ncbi:YraN family protein [Pseudobacteriovorax antillogorgiicola]|uniref:Putative endonuclease n=1 Tax=Pseudobacteriovorax antillogorgiicola TaxID=1513793 RepID=A0A1Y6B893_9BACT|nr:YraN family protein [Pseudobacteriovorax antillogorgiicola]TCS59310.1 putative endonuclease [Pseudobacteriovorax antillogorgiicola]SME89527.1 putative endonuclease [Pseudobacteriovorax antillogorgiicola]